MKIKLLLSIFILYNFQSVNDDGLHLKVVSVQQSLGPQNKKYFTVEISNSSNDTILIKGFSDDWIFTPILSHADTQKKVILLVPHLDSALGDFHLTLINHVFVGKDTINFVKNGFKPMVISGDYYIAPKSSVQIKLPLFLDSTYDIIDIHKLKGSIKLALNIDYYRGIDSYLYHAQLISEPYFDFNKIFN